MSNKNNIRKEILNTPDYWVEGINNFLFDAIVTFMEDNNMNRTKLAEHLNVSKGRISQILNDGETNFSIEKLVEISLKIGKFPDFKLIDKEIYLAKEASSRHLKKMVHFKNGVGLLSTYGSEELKEEKVIKLKPKNVYVSTHQYRLLNDLNAVCNG